MVLNMMRISCLCLLDVWPITLIMAFSSVPTHKKKIIYTATMLTICQLLTFMDYFDSIDMCFCGTQKKFIIFSPKLTDVLLKLKIYMMEKQLILMAFICV